MTNFDILKHQQEQEAEQEICWSSKEIRIKGKGKSKASDDSLITIATWPIQQFGPAATEQSFVVRLRSNAYQMVINDVVSIEFPSSATDGLEISTSTTEGNPSNYTGRSHNGTAWSNSSNPPALVTKGE